MREGGPPCFQVPEPGVWEEDALDKARGEEERGAERGECVAVPPCGPKSAWSRERSGSGAEADPAGAGKNKDPRVVVKALGDSTNRPDGIPPSHDEEHVRVERDGGVKGARAGLGRVVDRERGGRGPHASHGVENPEIVAGGPGGPRPGKENQGVPVGELGERRPQAGKREIGP